VSKADEIGVALKSLIASEQPGVLEIDVSQILADPFRYTIKQDYFKGRNIF
jgi:hypothetical protein